MAEPEQMLRFVGRLQSIHDAIETALKNVPDTEMHPHDLLVIAREAVHKAYMATWSKAPSFPEQTQTERRRLTGLCDSCKRTWSVDCDPRTDVIVSAFHCQCGHTTLMD